MKTSIWLPASSAMVLILSGCTNQNDPNDPLGTGPYDAAGNYHEEWADDPSKWRKPSKRPSTSGDDLPMIAKNDQPPPNANPLATTSSTSQKLPPAVVESAPKETKRQSGQEVEIASRSRSSSSAQKSKSRATASSDEPKSTPKRTTTKSKSKPKSKSSRYIVKKGDSLSAIASRNGSSVSAIQKANGINGTLIRPGQSLVVPKR
jgi:LysM repeat protein